MLFILIKGLLHCAVEVYASAGHVASKKCAKSPVLPCRLSAFPRSRTLCCKLSMGRTFAYTWNILLPVTNGTMCLPTRFVSAIVPFPIRRPLPLAAIGPGFPVMWRFLSCQNFSIKRTH